jgi:hypothetical protein
LPHSALSWNFSQAENLASLILEDMATKWHYTLGWAGPTLYLKLKNISGLGGAWPSQIARLGKNEAFLEKS